MKRENMRTKRFRWAAVALSVGLIAPVGALTAPASAAEWGGADLPPLVEHTGEGPTGYTVTFRLFDPVADRVQIRGEWTFTDSVTTSDDWYSLENKTPQEWEAGDVPVTSEAWPVSDLTRGKDGVWSSTIPLPGGVFNYSFLRDCEDDAGNGCEAFADPSNRAWNTTGPVSASSQVFVPADATFDQTDVSAFSPAQEQGRWTRVSYASSASTDPVGTHNASVYVPPGYDESRTVPYPTLYLSHGGGGNELEWSMEGVAGRIFDNVIASGRMQPTVIVATNFYGLDGEAGYLADVRDNVIPFIESEFNVGHDSSTRALAGLSLGSQRVQGVLENEPALFGSYAAWSGGRFPDAIIDWTPAQIEGMKAVSGGIVVGRGLQDFLAGSNTEAQEAQMEAAGIPYVEFVAPGGHTWQYWRTALENYVERVAFRTVELKLADANLSSAILDVVPFTANVTAPTGDVSVYVTKGAGEPEIVGTWPVDDASVAINFTRSKIPADIEELSVVYSGDALYNSATTTITRDAVSPSGDFADAAGPVPSSTAAVGPSSGDSEKPEGILAHSGTGGAAVLTALAVTLILVGLIARRRRGIVIALTS
jgi:enterochelin esterase-like enzyme